MIIEIAGKPPEYIKEVLEKAIEQLEKEEGSKLLNKNFHEPQLDAEKNLYSAFVEVELKINSLPTLVCLILEYLPSSIEIIKPSEMHMQISEVNGLVNDIAAKMHKVTEITRRVGTENFILKKQLSEIIKRVREKRKELEEKGSEETLRNQKVSGAPKTREFSSEKEESAEIKEEEKSVEEKKEKKVKKKKSK